MEEFLIGLGVSEETIALAPGAVDREIYAPVNSFPDKVFVLFSGNFKYRKNPELIAKVIAKMSDIDFVIHGLHWETFPEDSLNGLTNVRKIDFDLRIQPELMRQASLYVSLSFVEGGPYTILEALASGTPVIATDTGFAAEFITSSKGHLLPNPPDLDSVERSIRNGLNLKAEVWDKDLLDGKWKWEDLGRLIYE
jgi:glycosyltransferase involved in cell wall biosynthesis